MRESLEETVQRVAKPYGPRYKGQTDSEGCVTLNIGIAIHPCPTVNAIVVNYPGFDAEINGYNDKYRKVAEFISSIKVAAVIQMPNVYRSLFRYSDSVVADLKAVIEYAIENSSLICATNNPEIYLMGFSAGASAIAAACSDYPQIKKVLLMAPSGDAGEQAITEGLGKFTGEVYIAVGENDELVGKGVGKIFYNKAKKASRRDLRIVPDCDHHFRGTRNGQIMSKAPLWAFAGDKTFPDPEGGIKLY